jgi:hypothetical protein
MSIKQNKGIYYGKPQIRKEKNSHHRDFERAQHREENRGQNRDKESREGVRRKRQGRGDGGGPQCGIKNHEKQNHAEKARRPQGFKAGEEN